MTKRLFLATIAICTFSCSELCQQGNSERIIEPIPFSEVKITDDFWRPRLERHAVATLDVCIDQIENKTGRIRNFEKAAAGSGEHEGIFFDDSDVYKAMEGMAYSLISNPNPVVESKMDNWIDKIAAAQQEDGYLNTYFTLTGLDKRWTNIDKHEMYCGGHMIEAAVAYYQATGKRKFLDVAIRFADHLDNTFGEGKRNWVPGHEEIELALVKLYYATNDQRYLNLSKFLLDVRGNDKSFDETDIFWLQREGYQYCQAEIPVRQQSVITGHAVRAMYLYCGMADVAAATGDKEMVAALNRLWENVALRNMYITGGIGSSAHNEGVTEDYDLPNKEAYCETCASVGMVLWNSRMNSLSGDAKYVNVLERALYNGALAGVSLSGDRFFYVNPLESDGDHHRQEWFGCACCPSQISRFLPSVGSYIYGKSKNAIWVNLFIDSETKITVDDKNISIKQITAYPWDGRVSIVVSPEETAKFDIKIRKPDWADKNGYSVMLNGERIRVSADENGYITIPKRWEAEDMIDINWHITPQVITADSRIKANVGKRAICMGPLVYCMEEIDNQSSYDNALIADNERLETIPTTIADNEIIAIKANNHIFIPYYAWDNRAAGKMKVWVDCK